MKSLLLSVAILTCATVADAGTFAFYGPGGNAITGYTTSTGAFGYDTRGNSYRWTYTPSYPVYNPNFAPAYGYPVYRPYAPVLNDYYDTRRGYGIKW